MSSEALRHALSREFEVDSRGDVLRARRKRRLPRSGVLRLLIPRVVVTVAGGPRVSVRPDWVAWFMSVMCVGGLVVEVTTDRARYPRTYPPAFIYGLALGFFAALVWEWRQSRRAADVAVKHATGAVTPRAPGSAP